MKLKKLLASIAGGWRKTPAVNITRADLIGWTEVDCIQLQERTYNQDGLICMHSTEFAKDPNFASAYARARDTNSWWGGELHWRMHVLTWAARQALPLEGDFVECGTNRGASALMILESLGEEMCERSFHLFDTFNGLDPTISSGKELKHYEGLYPECYEEVKALFSPYASVHVVRGSVPQSLIGQTIEKVAFFHLDMNAAIPERGAIEFIWPLLVPHAIVVLDDYAWVACHEQKKTIDEFARREGVQVLSLPTGQGLLIKPPRC